MEGGGRREEGGGRLRTAVQWAGGCQQQQGHGYTGEVARARATQHWSTKQHRFALLLRHSHPHTDAYTHPPRRARWSLWSQPPVAAATAATTASVPTTRITSRQQRCGAAGAEVWAGAGVVGVGAVDTSPNKSEPSQASGGQADATVGAVGAASGV